MKPLLRFLFIIFYTIMSILYFVILFVEGLLILPIAFFYYIFTGKNYFHQDYDEFSVKIYYKFRKIMDNMDPDYEEPEEEIDYGDKPLYKYAQELCKVKSLEEIDKELFSELKVYKVSFLFIADKNPSLKYWVCVAKNKADVEKMSIEKFDKDIDIFTIELDENQTDEYKRSIFEIQQKFTF